MYQPSKQLTLFQAGSLHMHNIHVGTCMYDYVTYNSITSHYFYYWWILAYNLPCNRLVYVRLSRMVTLAGQPSTLTLVMIMLNSRDSCSCSVPSLSSKSLTITMSVQDSSRSGVRPFMVGCAIASSRVSPL